MKASATRKASSTRGVREGADAEGPKVKRLPRRLGTKDSATRAELIKAGVAVLQNEGASAFTARRVAEQAGLKQQLVYYYFRTMEDLLLAIIEHHSNEGIKRSIRAVTSDNTLRSLWEVTLAERTAALVSEVKSLGQHSEKIRTAMLRQMETHRIIMTEALTQHLERRGSKFTDRAMAIVMIVDAIARLIENERALDFDLGHDDLLSFIDGWLVSYYNS